MLIKQDIFVQTISLFFPNQKNYKLQQIFGGVNNWTKKLIIQQQQFVIRVYNNGKNMKKVKLQHELLLILQKIQKSFKTPEPQRIPGTSETIGLLSEGYPCCIIKFIQGSIPKQISRKGMQNFGKSISQISEILSKIKLSQQPIIKPYYDLYGVHHAIVNKQNLIKEINSSQYDSVRQSVQKLLEYIKFTQQKMKQYHDMRFPEQIIHGDIHTDNILMKNDKMTGILDFQFVAKDWRAMQMAISLSKYVNLENFNQNIIDFNRGYNSVVPLTQAQLLAIPWLIILRLVSNFIYFTGRVIAKQQSVQFCRQKIQLYRKRIDKLYPRVQQFQKTLLYKQI